MLHGLGLAGQRHQQPQHADALGRQRAGLKGLQRLEGQLAGGCQGCGAEPHPLAQPAQLGAGDGEHIELETIGFLELFRQLLLLLRVAKANVVVEAPQVGLAGNHQPVAGWGERVAHGDDARPNAEAQQRIAQVGGQPRAGHLGHDLVGGGETAGRIEKAAQQLHQRRVGQVGPRLGQMAGLG